MRAHSLFTVKGRDFDIMLDLHRGNVTIQQKWKYEWCVRTYADGTKDAPWTYKEKKAFHQGCDSQIWQLWSNYFKLNVTGSGAFAEKFKGRSLPLNFDLRWVTAHQHYRVEVVKGRAPSKQGSAEGVNSAARVIYLWTSSKDLHNTYRLPSGATSNTAVAKQSAVAHEFGHAIGYNHDDYKMDSEFCTDNVSIMNAGRYVRDRHIKSVLTQLNDMLPDTEFSLSKRR